MNTFAMLQRNDRGKAAQLRDAHSEAVTPHQAHPGSQAHLGQLLGGGPRAAEQAQLAQAISGVAQRQQAEEEESLQLKAEEVEQSRGGLPRGLKAGLEQMSGLSLDDVKVHYNSQEPAQLHALAYTQGSEIHIAPGQEQHLAHEAWHAVQQKQGRVSATTQMRGVSINDDQSLEREADVMGVKALQMKSMAGSLAEKLTAGRAKAHGPIQMLREIELPEEDYGSGYSREAMEKRVQDNIRPTHNIATFHFVPRPPLAGGGPPAEGGFGITEASTGIGMYQTVNERTEAQVRLNLSHSEHQIISGPLKALREREDFPQKNIIDWVYTERRACPDVWYGPYRRIADGCRTELEKVEREQKERVWDVGVGGWEPYGLRDDLEIAVYSTFAGSTEIRAATFFAPIRNEVYWSLVHKLTSLYQDRYASTGPKEEYDLAVYEQKLYMDAQEVADELPSWSDYHLSLNRAGQEVFREELLKEAEAIFKREQGEVQGVEEYPERFEEEYSPMSQ